MLSKHEQPWVVLDEEFGSEIKIAFSISEIEKVTMFAKVFSSTTVNNNRIVDTEYYLQFLVHPRSCTVQTCQIKWNKILLIIKMSDVGGIEDSQMALQSGSDTPLRQQRNRNLVLKGKV